MHVGSTLTSDDDDAAKRRWAPCSPLDDIADSDGTLPLPTIYSAGGNGGGRGGGGVDCIICPRLGVETGTLGLRRHNNVCLFDT